MCENSETWNLHTTEQEVVIKGWLYLCIVILWVLKTKVKKNLAKLVSTAILMISKWQNLNMDR